MAQVDFAVAFVVIFIMVSYAAFFVSNTMSKEFSYFNLKELEESGDSISNHLFYTADSKSLVTSFKKMQIVFEEVGDYSHTEGIVLSITPLVEKIHVYNASMVEIISSYSGGNLSFDLSFSSNQKNYVDVFYKGEVTGVSYVSDNNITAKVLYEEEIAVLSQEKCDQLKALLYDDAKSIFGTTNNFRLEGYCSYGETPPADANVVVKMIPAIIEDSGLHAEYVILKVW